MLPFLWYGTVAGARIVAVCLIGRVELSFRVPQGDQKGHMEVVSLEETVVGVSDFNWDT